MPLMNNDDDDGDDDDEEEEESYKETIHHDGDHRHKLINIRQTREIIISSALKEEIEEEIYLLKKMPFWLLNFPKMRNRVLPPGGRTADGDRGVVSSSRQYHRTEHRPTHGHG